MKGTGCWGLVRLRKPPRVRVCPGLRGVGPPRPEGTTRGEGPPPGKGLPIVRVCPAVALSALRPLSTRGRAWPHCEQSPHTQALWVEPGGAGNLQGLLLGSAAGVDALLCGTRPHCQQALSAWAVCSSPALGDAMVHTGGLRPHPAWARVPHSPPGWPAQAWDAAGGCGGQGCIPSR